MEGDRMQRVSAVGVAESVRQWRADAEHIRNCLLGGICGWFDKVSGHPCGRSLTEALAFSCFNLPL